MKQFPKILSRITASAVLCATLPFASTATAQENSYPDLDGHWAEVCVQNLSQEGIISGYPDGTFRPNNPVTRAEFAAFVTAAFPNLEPERQPIDFGDIPPNYWADDEIRQAYRLGFLSGYPGQRFKPEQSIPRVQAFVALASGLKYPTPNSVPETLLAAYGDAALIPKYSWSQIAAATNEQIVIVELIPAAPQVQYLNPDEQATRAQIAAAICQAKYDESFVPSQYVVDTEKFTIDSVQETAGDTQAQLFSQMRGDGGLANFFLDITHDNQRQLLDTVPLSKPAQPIDGVNLVVEDLNGNGEAEVLIELIGADPVCCLESNIYRSTQNQYELAERIALPFLEYGAETAYDLKDLDNNGEPEFDSANLGWRNAFVEPGNRPIYFLPEQIWDYRQGELEDVTADYPDLVDDDAYRWWQKANELKETEAAPYPQLKTALAAYLADKYTLGEADEGWQLVRQVYQKRDRDQYFAELEEYLNRFGYSR